MTRHPWIAAAVALCIGTLVPLSAAGEEFELTAPDGRRVLLKTDGTWRYADADKAGEESKPVVKGEGVLMLEVMEELGQNCKVGFRMQNDLDHEIRNIVPRFVVFRTNGVAYEARTLAFYSINPGNGSYRETLFRGIACAEIGRIQVTGGDRCVVGDLDRFTYTGGACLERVRVVPSDRVRFDK
jgi:hypothetical protein